MIITLVKIQREKYYISTKEINLKKQGIAKGIKEELTLKVHFALVTSYKVDKLLYRGGGCDLRFDPPNCNFQFIFKIPLSLLLKIDLMKVTISIK